VEHWLDLRGIKNGPQFRAAYGKFVHDGKLNSYTITRIVKGLAQNVGLSDETVGRISGHSLRIGAELDLIEHGIALVPSCILVGGSQQRWWSSIRNRSMSPGLGSRNFIVVSEIPCSVTAADRDYFIGLHACIAN
jgi:hypothetical protein